MQTAQHIPTSRSSSLKVLLVVREIQSLATVLAILHDLNWVHKAIADQFYLVLVLGAQLSGHLFRDAQTVIHIFLIVADVARLLRKLVIVVQLALEEHINCTWYLKCGP